MNIAQKIITALAILALSYVFFGIEYKEKTHKCKIVFNDRLVEIIVKDKDFDELRLKSDNGILFTDGEYFYDEPPTIQKDIQRTKIVSIDTYRGWEPNDMYGLIFVVILLHLALFKMFSDEPDDEYFY